MSSPRPCPWCGPTPRFGQTAVMNMRRDAWHVVCARCDASGPRKPTEAEAVAAWDRVAVLSKEE